MEHAQVKLLLAVGRDRLVLSDGHGGLGRGGLVSAGQADGGSDGGGEGTDGAGISLVLTTWCCATTHRYSFYGQRRTTAFRPFIEAFGQLTLMALPAITYDMVKM
jgi:hypothetical protein